MVGPGYPSVILTYASTRFYFEDDPLRVAACPLTIHALLHIAPSIRIMGPMWTYWVFPIERFCGSILPNIKSRRYPYKNIDNYVAACAHLTQVSLLYGLQQELSFQPPSIPGNNISIPGCKWPSTLGTQLIYRFQTHPLFSSHLSARLYSPRNCEQSLLCHFRHDSAKQLL